MNLPILRLTKEELSDFDNSITKEWVITNGLGGYASSTVLGINSRKYHGLLVAALNPPGDRTVCLEKLDEEIALGDRSYQLGSNEFKDASYPTGFKFLEEFSLSPLPQFIYSIDEVTVAKTIFMFYEENETIAIYKCQNKGELEATFRITPLITCRHFHTVLSRDASTTKFSLKANGSHRIQLEFVSPNATIDILLTEGEFVKKPNWIEKIYYREEASRGESSISDSYQPGYFQTIIPPNSEKVFAIVAKANAYIRQNNEDTSGAQVSTEDVLLLYSRELRRQAALLESFYSSHSNAPVEDWLSWILWATDTFLVRGFNKGKSVIAGYHWFEAWGRDTFLSLPGLMLVTGRFEEARKVLSDFNKFCMQGLIPNFLSDLSALPSCNTVDATLWHVNAVLQYLKYTGDFRFVQNQLWESLKEIVENHVQGTAFGIRVDNDGLLEHGPRLTWMDAEVDGKGVTSRAGKAVEIQALWYNALRTIELIATERREKKLAESYAQLANRAKISFNSKFWNQERNCLFDVIDDVRADASLRPNQVIAASLDFNLLSTEKNLQVIEIVQDELLTSFGLRTLERKDQRYRGEYSGYRKNRDLAYHNGTVWPWLLGPFTTAYVKAKGKTTKNLEYASRNFLEPLFKQQVTQAGLGTVSEIFDGDKPHTPRGCISQAWSVAEPLRAYVEDILQIRPKFEKEVLKNSN
jgi:predicted glycogen debranching enzyme